MNRSLFCIANKIPTHFANELILHSKVKSYLLLKDKLDCYPESYILPDELEAFEEAKEKHDLWILKEEMIDRGEGVFVFSKNDPIPPYVSEKVVIQKYIGNPSLCENKKWGFRTVVLFEGTRTLHMWDNIYIYCSSTDYTTENIEDRNIHVTNRRVQVKAGHEVITMDWKYIVDNVLKEKEGQVIEECKNIMKTCLNSLELTENDKRGYAMFAFDFLLDEDFKVWLIEINSSPGNMAMSSRMRYPDTPLLVEEVAQIMIDSRHLGRERTSFKFEIFQDGALL
eukprot:TRINITY_DN11312_c0_g1_i1.p1 TRINITY_DN11312_c0_g1~~TRINITY_DN11312_c0_g1_i1.p1  ORF type:complete len:289 (+),score=70.27 TRINITY_DN11312_c0_g1_i1:23-868(+)